MASEEREAVIRAFERCLLDGDEGDGERDPCSDALDAYAAAIRAEAVAEWREAVRPLFDQSGCDCDSAWLSERTGGEGGDWPAPHHASDCPVYERWEPAEDRLRALLEGAS